MATRAELLLNVGEELKIIGVGDILPAEHESAIDSAYVRVYTQLQKDGLAFWAIDDNIPDEVVFPLSNLICKSLLNKYAVSNEQYNRVIATYQESKKDIKKFATPNYVSHEDVEDF
jgi:hypothetical protein